MHHCRMIPRCIVYKLLAPFLHIPYIRSVETGISRSPLGRPRALSPRVGPARASGYNWAQGSSPGLAPAITSAGQPTAWSTSLVCVSCSRLEQGSTWLISLGSTREARVSTPWMYDSAAYSVARVSTPWRYGSAVGKRTGCTQSVSFPRWFHLSFNRSPLMTVQVCPDSVGCRASPAPQPAGQRFTP